MVEPQDTSRRMYKVKCTSGHSQELTATGLEQLIRSSEYECRHCKKRIMLTSGLELVCIICTDASNVSDLEAARNTMDTVCTTCAERNLDEYSIHVRNSWDYFEAIDQWRHNNGVDEERLRRKGRTDYWEAVIHFCEPHEFASIYRERKIRAERTGYFKVPAVCLTEAPVGNWEELQNRHGSFGYVFLKRDLIAAGGGPAVYLSDELINAQKTNGGFCDELKPFLNLLRIPSAKSEKTKHDFLHEREWRLPNNLLFDKAHSHQVKQTEPYPPKHIQPYAIIVGSYDMNTEGWEEIRRAQLEFEELGTS